MESLLCIVVLSQVVTSADVQTIKCCKNQNKYTQNIQKEFLKRLRSRTISTKYLYFYITNMFSQNNIPLLKDTVQKHQYLLKKRGGI